MSLTWVSIKPMIISRKFWVLLGTPLQEPAQKHTVLHADAEDWRTHELLSDYPESIHIEEPVVLEVLPADGLLHVHIQLPILQIVEASGRH